LNSSRFLSVCVLGIILSTTPLWAVEAKRVVPLTLDEAVHLALQARPEMRIEKEKVKIARSKVKENRGNFLPSLDLNGSSTYTKNFDTFTGINISARIANQDVSVNITKEVPKYVLNGDVDLSYNLYAGGHDMALLRATKSELESQKHQQTVTEQNIHLEVINAYWNLKISKIRYLMAKRDLNVMHMEVKVARTKHQTSRLSDIDYESVLLKEKEKEMALRTSDRACLQAFQEYLHTLDLPAEKEIVSSEQVPMLTDDPSVGDDYGNVEVHPEVLKILSDIKAKRELVKVARSEDLPKVDLFATYALIGRDTDSYLSSWSDLGREDYVAGVKISMNLFNGLKTQERIQQARAEVRVKQLQLLEKKRELEKSASIKKADIGTAKDRLDFAVEREQLLGAREKVAASKFGSGRISKLAYRQEALEAQNAQSDAVIARINVVLAENALKLLLLGSPAE